MLASHVGALLDRVHESAFGGLEWKAGPAGLIRSLATIRREKSGLAARIRSFVFPLAALAAVVLTVIALPTSPLLAAAAETSVILITIDTLRADHLESYGYEYGKTPAISSLAREGILFENVIVQTPITLPSHASILTGTYPHFHGLQDVVGRLREDVPMVSEWFQQKGYATGAFVGASVLMAQWGLDRGFDVYEDTFATQGLAQIDFSRVERPAGRVAELAHQWVAETPPRPFFLWLHLYDPHDPYIPPEPFATEFKDRPYDGEIAYVDSVLAEFFARLKKLGLYEDSLIIFTSDHGESLGEHKEAYHAYYIYDASIRIPLIIRVPEALRQGRLQPGTRIPNQVRSVDILPTLLQLLGEQVPPWVQGEGLLGVMAGKRPDVNLPAYAETHYPRIHFGWSPLFSYSTPDYKFIEAPKPELYNLEEDPGELRNIYRDNQALAHKLREELHGLQRRYAAPPSREQASPQVDNETIERLKALGYVAFSSGSGGDSVETLPDPKDKIDTYNQLNLAIELSRRGRSGQAIALLQEVARQEPQMPIAHFLLGSEYFSQRLYLKAAEEFQATIERNPESNVARFSLARSYSQSGLWGRAEEVIRELLLAEPGHFGARHLLATLHGKRGQYEEAISEELKALKIRPSFVDGHNNLGSYYWNLGRVQEAVQSYLKAVQYAPRHVLARTNLSLGYLRLKDYDAALQHALKVIEINPGESLAYYYMGQAYLGKGMEPEARTAFAKAKELDPRLTVPIS